MLTRVFLALLALVPLCVKASDGAPTQKPPALVWDAMEKTIDAKPGEHTADFEFRVTNKSDRRVEIVQLRPSCGCTVADLPATPWILEPEASGAFRATVDFRGKHGRFSKAIFVHSTAGTQVLSVVVNIPEAHDEERKRNQMLAAANRQAVFRGECAACHITPAADKTGPDLFMTACGTCHFSERRASVVPDLSKPREPRDAEFWRKWISEGKEHTLMPAFAQEKGGPLKKEQIDSLVEFAMSAFPTQPLKN